MTTKNARTTDPITSKKAALSLGTKSYSQAMLLLSQFAKKSMTAEESGESAGLLNTGYWKRVSDLHRDFFIEPRRLGGMRGIMTRPTKSGRQAVVWKITTQGREALKRYRSMKQAAA